MGHRIDISAQECTIFTQISQFAQRLWGIRHSTVFTQFLSMWEVVHCHLYKKFICPSCIKNIKTNRIYMPQEIWDINNKLQNTIRCTCNSNLHVKMATYSILYTFMMCKAMWLHSKRTIWTTVNFRSKTKCSFTENTGTVIKAMHGRKKAI